VHLEHNGAMLAFLLDILKVPESHTGVALAKVFQQMLEAFGLQDQVCLSFNVILLNSSSQQILAMNADNATLNDTQGESLADMPNSFQLENHVCCFNHTLQLSVKTLLHPFNVGLGKAMEDRDSADVDDLLDDDDDEDKNKDKDKGKGKDEDLPDVPDINDINDSIDELDMLDADEWEAIIADTAAVCETVSKLCHLAFSIV